MNLLKRYFQTSVIAVILASLFSVSVVTPAVADGITWTSQTTPVDGGNLQNAYQSVTYGNGVFMAVGTGPATASRVLTSTDGSNWTMRLAATIDDWTSVTYGTINTIGYFVGVSRSGGNRVMASTNNGLSWLNRAAPANNTWQSVTYGNGVFVAVSSNGANRVMTTNLNPTTSAWTSPATAVATGAWQSVTYGDGVFVAVSSDGANRVMRSTDNGQTWTSPTSAVATGAWQSVTYGDGVFVAVSSDGDNRVMRSIDNGLTWSLQTAAASNAWQSVTYGDGVFVAVSDSTSGTIADRVMTSPDGITWTARTAAANNNWQSVAYGTISSRGVFVAVSDSGNLNRVMTSQVSAPAFSLSSSSESRTVDTAATGFTTTSTGGPFARFSINATPPGMSFNTTTGALTGTPNTVAPATTYTVTATNASGTATRTFALTVTAALAAPAFTLSSSSETRTVNTAATGFTINSTGGAIASFSVNATPPGMSFNTTTGALTGTPSTVAPATTYTVTATNASGNATQTFALTVTAAQAAAYAYEAGAAAEANRLLYLKLLHATANTAASYSELAALLAKKLESSKCFKGKVIKYVNPGTKCPVGYVRKK